MKKVGFIAASVGAALLLAVGAVALTTTLMSPNHGVEQANAVELAPVAATQTVQSASDAGNRGGWFSWFGGGAAQTPEAASADGERQVLPGITTRTGSDQSSSSTTAEPSRASSDDDDDDD